MKKAIPFLLAGTLIFTYCKTKKQQENTAATPVTTPAPESAQKNQRQETEFALNKKSATREERVAVAKELFAADAAITDIAEKRWAGTKGTTDLNDGKVIYTTKCVKCHINYPIEEFSEKKWIHEIDDMSPKAKLTAEEKLKLTKYILSYREYKAGSPKGN